MANKIDFSNLNILSLELPKPSQTRKVYSCIHMQNLSLVVQWGKGTIKRVESSSHEYRKAAFRYMWRFRYRLDGKRTSMDFGSWPEIEQDRAVEIAEGLGREAANGVDIGAKKRDAINATFATNIVADSNRTVSALCRSFLKWRESNVPGKVETTKFYRSKINNHILPRFGLFAINALTAWVWQEYLRKIADGGSENLAIQVNSTLSVVYSFGVESEDFDEIKANPFLRLPLRKQLKPSNPGDRFFSNTELYQWMNEISTVASPARWRCLMLQLYQGTRIKEVVDISISDLAFLGQSYIPIVVKGGRESKTMVSPQAISLIKDQLRVYVSEGVKPKYLFEEAGVKFDTAKMGGFIRTIRDKGWLQFQSHDLRRTLRTWLQEFGAPKEIRDQMTDHVIPKGKDSSYDHAARLAEKLRWAKLWADKLDEIKVSSSAFTMSISTAIDEDEQQEISDLLGLLT